MLYAGIVVGAVTTMRNVAEKVPDSAAVHPLHPDMKVDVLRGRHGERMKRPEVDSVLPWAEMDAARSVRWARNSVQPLSTGCAPALWRPRVE